MNKYSPLNKYAPSPIYDFAPPGGPHALPLTSRVLYELVLIWDIFHSINPEYRVVLERHLLFSLQQPLGFRLPKRGSEWDHVEAPVDPAVRAQLEAALRELAEEGLVELVDRTGPSNEWRVRPTAAGWRHVHDWKNQYIREYETLTVEPAGWRKVTRDFFASETISKTIWGVIGGILVFLATHFPLH